MLIVPVIDLCKGVVVHALKGNRKEYKAIDSKLCSSASPLVVINAYLKVFNFKHSTNKRFTRTKISSIYLKKNFISKI